MLGSHWACTQVIKDLLNTQWAQAVGGTLGSIPLHLRPSLTIPPFLHYLLLSYTKDTRSSLSLPLYGSFHYSLSLYLLSAFSLPPSFHPPISTLPSYPSFTFFPPFTHLYPSLILFGKTSTLTPPTICVSSSILLSLSLQHDKNNHAQSFILPSTCASKRGEGRYTPHPHLSITPFIHSFISPSLVKSLAKLFLSSLFILYFTPIGSVAAHRWWVLLLFISLLLFLHHLLLTLCPCSPFKASFGGRELRRTVPLQQFSLLSLWGTGMF